VHDYFALLKKWSIYVTMVLISIVLVVLLIILVFYVWDLVVGNSIFIEGKTDILNLLGLFLLVVVILEIMETMYIYATKEEIHVGAVVLIAITAISRELIIFNYEHVAGTLLAGAGILIASLATAYYLILRAHRDFPGEREDHIK
jgi:uncharacterized membrane protein (DUF373 family)